MQVHLFLNNCYFIYLIRLNFCTYLGTDYTINLDFGETYTLQSPNFPNQYPINSRITWTFEADSGGYYIEFSTVNIEDDLYIGFIGTEPPDFYAVRVFSRRSGAVYASPNIWVAFNTDNRYSYYFSSSESFFGFEMFVTRLSDSGKLHNIIHFRLK